MNQQDKSTEIIRIEHPTAISSAKGLIQFLRECVGKAHLLTPIARTEFYDLQPYTKPSIRTTTLSTNLDDGQIYEQSRGKFALTKLGLEKLDQLAGIQWMYPVRDRHGRVIGGTFVQYSSSNPYFAVGFAHGRIIDVDGKPRDIIASRTCDLNDGAPEAEILREKSYDRLASARQNICQLAETKAKNRVRRELLQIPPTFNAHEIAKPFVIVKLIDDTKAMLDSDEHLDRMYKARKLGIEPLIYGPEESTATDGNIAIETGDTAQQIPAEEPIQHPPEDAKLLQIKRIENLYLRKLNRPRDPKNKTLADLQDHELDAVEDKLLEKPDHPEWIKQNPDSIL